MNVHIVTGGCGFVGRNMVKYLYTNTKDAIFIIDDLSSGLSPDTWLDSPKILNFKNVEIYNDRIFFVNKDVRQALVKFDSYRSYLFEFLQKEIVIADVFHFAAIVGGRLTIENDPLNVAIDLSIDAIFFKWVSREKPKRVLYPSSSAAYPIDYQTKENHRSLKESDINFNIIRNPDMTYGWAKLTGEYLARLAASKYGVSVTCIRPFSGYGPDQDFTYPIPAIIRRFVQRENPIEVWGDGTQSRDFIFIDDLIEGTIRAMDIVTDGSAINLGSGKRTSFLEIIGILKKISTFNPEIRPISSKPVGVFARYANIEYLRNTLNWYPSNSLTEGLTQTYKQIAKTLNQFDDNLYIRN